MRIENAKLDFKDKAHAKVGSLSNVSHTPGGGNVMVTERLTYSEHGATVVLTLRSSPAD